MSSTKPAPLLSIIMPVYRVESTLSEAVSSILSQRLTDFELLLIDDGSPDGCPALCETFARQDARIRVFHQQNRGLSVARNAGIDAARGEWLAFVDSDDFLAPDCYERLFAAAEDAQADIAVCSVCRVDDTGVSLPGQWEALPKQTLFARDALSRLSDPSMLVVWNKIFRREFFQTLRFPEGHLNEDVFICVAVFRQARCVVTIPDRLYHYRRSPGSITTQPRTLRHLDEVFAFATCIESLAALHITAPMKKLEAYQYYALRNVNCRLSQQERKSATMQEACDAHRRTLRLLARNGQLRFRALVRSVAFHLLRRMEGFFLR